MKMKLSSCVIIISILVLCNSSFAQMYQVTNTIKTPYGNVKTTEWRDTPNYHMYNGPRDVSYKYRFEVAFSKDSVVTLLTSLHFDTDTTYFKMKGNSRKKIRITPSNTISIRRLPNTSPEVIGFPADSCWLFKVQKGTINGYSKWPETDGTGVIVAVQDGDDGPIVAATKDNLSEMVGDDPDALHDLKKRNFNVWSILKAYNKKQATSGRPGRIASLMHPRTPFPLKWIHAPLNLKRICSGLWNERVRVVLPNVTMQARFSVSPPEIILSALPGA